MSAHPTLPLYVAGTSDGHVGLWSFAASAEANVAGGANGVSGVASEQAGENECLF